MAVNLRETRLRHGIIHQEFLRGRTRKKRKRVKKRDDLSLICNSAQADTSGDTRDEILNPFAEKRIFTYLQRGNRIGDGQPDASEAYDRWEISSVQSLQTMGG